MAEYTKETVKQDDGSEVVRYKDGKNYVPTNKVPTNVVNALEGADDSTKVDELGDLIDPSTQTDDSSDDDDPNATEDDTTPAPKTPSKSQTRRRAASRRKAAADPEDNVEYEDDEDGNPQEVGMGWPRKNGKTVDIFTGEPHETVRNVQGVLVPLTHANATGDEKRDIEAKTDAEIIDKLKELGRL